jgi:hypothetical protein
MTQTLHKNTNGLQILTDTGWENFAGVVKKNIKPTLRIVTQTKTIECTADHELFNYRQQKIAASKLKPKDKLMSATGIERVVSVSLAKIQLVYDILNSGIHNRFYANDLLVSNCEFILFEETLINSLKLADMEGSEPLYKTGQVRWFKKPSRGHIYTVALDPSLGTGGDAAAIQIFEADTTTQIGEWFHNRTTIPEQVRLLAEICRQINEITGEAKNIYYSLENNSIGEAALISLAEFGEENITGTMLSEPKRVGSSRRYRRGFNTTNSTKLSACSKFKNLLESDKLTVRSSSLISELKTFVASGGSYAAKLGETDDLVMATLLTVRMMQHLRDYNIDLDSHLRDHGNGRGGDDDDIDPLPFIATF